MDWAAICYGQAEKTLSQWTHESCDEQQADAFPFQILRKGVPAHSSFAVEGSGQYYPPHLCDGSGLSGFAAEAESEFTRNSVNARSLKGIYLAGGNIA